jgi:hypothetical protein
MSQTDQSDTPRAGDEYAFPAAGNVAVTMRINRVARDGSWADMTCRGKFTGREWTKRQPTPIPGERVTGAAAY